MRVYYLFLSLIVMKRLLLYLLLLFSLPIGAKDISDYYVMRPRTNDLLYFILPIEITSTERNIEAAAFDITYITSEENATINMTIYADESLQTDSIIFFGRGVRYVSKQLDTFYVEKEKKKGWAHRYSCKVPFADIQQLYTSSMPWQLIVCAKEKNFTYAQGKRVWKEEQKRMTEILTIIQVNKQVSQ